MDSHRETDEHDISHYPDPEESGLNFPWLDQYQPVAAESLSTRLPPLIHDGYIPQENGSTSALPNEFRHLIPQEEIFKPSAGPEDPDQDPDFMETDAEAE